MNLRNLRRRVIARLVVVGADAAARDFGAGGEEARQREGACAAQREPPAAEWREVALLAEGLMGERINWRFKDGYGFCVRVIGRQSEAVALVGAVSVALVTAQSATHGGEPGLLS